MNDERIQKIIRELEILVPKENGDAEFATFGEVALYASKEAFLRLGMEFLKKAYDDSNTIDINYLFSENSDFFIDHLTKDKGFFDSISS